MYERELAARAREKFASKERIVVPLVGFPGLSLTGSTVKVATQNARDHMAAMKAIVEEYSPDVVFQLMDLTLEANALGQFTVFPVREPSSIPTPEESFEVSGMKELEEIDVAADSRIQGFLTTMKLMAEELPKDVLRGSYITGPFTLAALILGAERAAMATIREKDTLHALCEFSVGIAEKYMKLQIAAGAQVLCILEPTGGMLSPKQFQEFSGNYIKMIIDRLQGSTANIVLHICGNTMHITEMMLATGVDALSLDSRSTGVDLSVVAEKTPEDIAVLGNISPTEIMLLADPDEVKSSVEELMDIMRNYPHFILSTGCDLPQALPLENLSAFMKAGRENI
ncbi:MAG: uroporphyrinogen decarboxylase family protein [Candidatus Auribacterota bacterium]|nr:uroporphyrinogen decarboxylase family protein [Candidatus Auribacterota bacterium]